MHIHVTNILFFNQGEYFPNICVSSFLCKLNEIKFENVGVTLGIRHGKFEHVPILKHRFFYERKKATNSLSTYIPNDKSLLPQSRIFSVYLAKRLSDETNELMN